MFCIKNLACESDAGAPTLNAVAHIESLVQPSEPWTTHAIGHLLTQESVELMVARGQDHKVVGYCLYQVLFEQAEILRIGTHPDYQRQGIASQLFAKLNTKLLNDKVENLLLDVRADNFSAIALYEQQGLAVIHRRKGYYQIPHRPAVDALIMQRVSLMAINRTDNCQP